MTNYERLLPAIELLFGKGWDEESFAHFYADCLTDDCSGCPVTPKECDKRGNGKTCVDVLLEWLKEPAKEKDPISLMVVDEKIEGYESTYVYAKRMGVQMSTINAWRKRKKLKTLKIGRQLWIKSSEKYPEKKSKGRPRKNKAIDISASGSDA